MPNGVTYRGTKAPLQQRYVRNVSPTTGVIQQWEYKGFDRVLMEGLMDTYVNAGCEARMSIAFDIATLEITDPRGERTIDTWQIQQQALKISNLENPRYTYNGSAYYITPQKRDLIKYALDENLTSLDEAFVKKSGDNKWVLRFTGAPAFTPLDHRLFDRMKLDSQQFDRSVYSLRHTTNAPNNYTVNVADENVDTIYSTAQLLSETQDFRSWILPLPKEMAFFISNLNFPQPRDFYKNGWFKWGGSRVVAANYRIELSTQYDYGQHSTDDYALSSY